MFLRSVKAPNGRHQYLRLVESVREGKKVKQRVVAHLGRKDQLAPHLDALIRLLQDETQAPRLPHYRKAKAKRQLPAATATYCLPFTAYVIGPEAITPPTATFHNRAPLRASSAKKYPSRPPLNSRSESVVRMPASVTSAILNSHFVS